MNSLNSSSVRLTRKEKKKMKEELKRLSSISERELKIYQMLSNPNNQTMKILGSEEDSEELSELWQKELWK